MLGILPIQFDPFGDVFPELLEIRSVPIADPALRICLGNYEGGCFMPPRLKLDPSQF